MKRLINHVHIVGGNGQMGQWLCSFLRAQNMIVTVSGNDHSGIENQQRADAIILSVPISEVIPVAKQVKAYWRPDTLIIDSSSIKQHHHQLSDIVSNPILSLHMLFGPTVASLNGQYIIMLPGRHNRKSEEFKQLLQKNGASLVEMEAEAHDKLMGFIQNLTHFINITLAQTLLKNNILEEPLRTPVFTSQLATLERVVSQNPLLLTEIQLANTDGKKIIKQFLHDANQLLDQIEKTEKTKIIQEIASIHAELTPHPKKNQELMMPTQNLQLSPGSTVAFLGPEGTYTHQALCMTISTQHKIRSCASVFEVFELVSQGSVDYGVIPAENTTEGSVRETLDFLHEFDLYVQGSVDLPIHHALLSKEKSLKDVKIVISHPQALAQTREFIQKNLPGVITKSATSTASSITQTVDSQVGFIGSKALAKILNLRVLAENIEDKPNNLTRFYIISRNKKSLITHPQRTLIFLSVFNRVGVLRDVLTIFADEQINLSKIESRPSHEKNWDYHFFIELEISPDHPKLLESMNLLKKFCPVIKVLGGYCEAT